MSQDLRDVQPLTGTLMGGAFFLAGTAILFVALGWIEVDASSVHAPRWVLGVCGGIFALTGMVTFYYGFVNGVAGRGGRRSGRERTGRDEDGFYVGGWLLGLVLCVGMAVVAGWIAFGPGEREFSGSVGVGGLEAGGSGGGETLGRWVFGFGAVLTGGFAIYGLIYGLRKLLGRSLKNTPPPREP